MLHKLGIASEFDLTSLIFEINKLYFSTPVYRNPQRSAVSNVNGASGFKWSGKVQKHRP